LIPAAKLAALTFKLAEAEPLVMTTGALPSELLPDPKTTVPAGCDEPVTGLTIAVSCVVPVGEIDVGLAVRVIVVPTIAPAPSHFRAKL
jgi:hypothetical protein